MERDEHLRQELDEFKKEKERIRNIVGEIGGKNNKQHKIVSMIFVLLILNNWRNYGFCRKEIFSQRDQHHREDNYAERQPFNLRQRLSAQSRTQQDRDHRVNLGVAGGESRTDITD